MLKNLVTTNELDVVAAYGSYKDIIIYASLNIPASKTYVLGSSRKSSSNCTVSIFNLLSTSILYIYLKHI